MKIAILSDVHDHWDNLGLVLKDIKLQACDYILHLGDYGAPGLSVKPLLELCIPVFGIWGNNDGEKWKIMKLFEASPISDIARTVYGNITLGGKRIGMLHYDDMHETLARSGDFNVVCYGHSHLRYRSRIGNTLVINPGAVCGNKETSSYALYDTNSEQVEFREF